MCHRFVEILMKSNHRLCLLLLSLELLLHPANKIKQWKYKFNTQQTNGVLWYAWSTKRLRERRKGRDREKEAEIFLWILYGNFIIGIIIYQSNIDFNSIACSVHSTEYQRFTFWFRIYLLNLVMQFTCFLCILFSLIFFFCLASPFYLHSAHPLTLCAIIFYFAFSTHKCLRLILFRLNLFMRTIS